MNNYSFEEKDKIANENFNDLEREVYSNIEENFKQIGEYKQGKRKFKSLKESKSLWDKWVEEVEEYTDNIKDGKVSPQESLKSLIDAGICDVKGNLTDTYKPLTLKQIQEKNRTNTTLLGSEIESQEYSDELVNQCKEEFKTFVKPIRDEVVGRYIKDCSKKYHKALKNLADS